MQTSLVEPLPHQITAVYGEMLPRLPLRFLLADDPGAGKTIMAGLLIKELMRSAYSEQDSTEIEESSQVSLPGCEPRQPSLRRALTVVHDLGAALLKGLDHPRAVLLPQ